MANEKISQYTAIGSVSLTDLLDISEDLGASTYQTRSATAQQLKDLISPNDPAAGTVIGQMLYWNGSGWVASASLIYDETADKMTISDGGIFNIADAGAEYRIDDNPVLRNMTTGLAVGKDAGNAQDLTDVTLLGDNCAQAGGANMLRSVIGGTNAANNSTHMADSVVWGYNAGINNTTGIRNIILGSEAMADGVGVSTGNGNVLIGYRAAYMANGTPSFNIAIGDETLRDITEGDSNTVLGYNAGINITSGNNNVLVGRDAGRDLTNNSACVFLGHNAGQMSTVSNLLIIENSNDITNPLIYGIFGTSSTNNLSVNTNQTPATFTIRANGNAGVSQAFQMQNLSGTPGFIIDDDGKFYTAALDANGFLYDNAAKKGYIQGTSATSLFLKRPNNTIDQQCWLGFQLWDSGNNFANYGFIGTAIADNTAGSVDSYIILEPYLNNSPIQTLRVYGDKTSQITDMYIEDVVGNNNGLFYDLGAKLLYSHASGGTGIYTRRADNTTNIGVFNGFQLYDSANAFVTYGWIGAKIQSNATGGNHDGYIAIQPVLNGASVDAVYFYHDNMSLETDLYIESSHGTDDGLFYDISEYQLRIQGKGSAGANKTLNVFNSGGSPVAGIWDNGKAAFLTIQTADPGSGVGVWKLGQVQSASVTLDTANYVEVDIGGSLVKLAIVT